jgi:hypothetical protein
MHKVVRYYAHSDVQRDIIDKEDVITIDGKRYLRGDVQLIERPLIRVEFHLMEL